MAGANSGIFEIKEKIEGKWIYYQLENFAGVGAFKKFIIWKYIRFSTHNEKNGICDRYESRICYISSIEQAEKKTSEEGIFDIHEINA